MRFYIGFFFLANFLEDFIVGLWMEDFCLSRCEILVGRFLLIKMRSFGWKIFVNKGAKFRLEEF